MFKFWREKGLKLIKNNYNIIVDVKKRPVMYGNYSLSLNGNHSRVKARSGPISDADLQVIGRTIADMSLTKGGVSTVSKTCCRPLVNQLKKVLKLNAREKPALTKIVERWWEQTHETGIVANVARGLWDEPLTGIDPTLIATVEGVLKQAVACPISASQCETSLPIGGLRVGTMTDAMVTGLYLSSGLIAAPSTDEPPAASERSNGGGTRTWADTVLSVTAPVLAASVSSNPVRAGLMAAVLLPSVSAKDAAGPNLKTDQSSLHSAAARGDTQTLSDLIKGGAPVNLENERGETPLYLAIVNRHLGVVELLLEHEADMGCIVGKDLFGKPLSEVPNSEMKAHIKVMKSLEKQSAQNDKLNKLIKEEDATGIIRLFKKERPVPQLHTMIGGESATAVELAIRSKDKAVIKVVMDLTEPILKSEKIEWLLYHIEYKPLHAVRRLIEGDTAYQEILADRFDDFGITDMISGRPYLPDRIPEAIRGRKGHPESKEALISLLNQYLNWKMVPWYQSTKFWTTLVVSCTMPWIMINLPNVWREDIEV